MVYLTTTTALLALDGKMESEFIGLQIIRIRFILVSRSICPLFAPHWFCSYEGISAFVAVQAMTDLLLSTAQPSLPYHTAFTAQNCLRKSVSPHQKILQYMMNIICN